MRPRVRLLVPVWGRSYIKRFTDLSVPCFLAPGNLPALAALTDLEIVMLTAAENFADFDREPAFRRMREIAPVRFIAIDDLIVDRLYGVILTLAYLRGVTDAGEDMVNVNFLFMNSDLLLADGSLRSVGERVLAGRRVMLACSIRATSEDLEDTLRAMVDARTHVLAVPPRRLVGMALNAMHPTQIAKIVNNDLCHSIHVNQFYWQVDENTLVSRHFLMFMLCLKPERVVREVRAFCDYSFVPEMCPTAEHVAMDDSDDFFFLEMQARESEADFLRIGRPGLDEIARGLSNWTTREHRLNALDHTLVFHAADLPAATGAMRAEADRYIREIQGRLAAEPQPHRDHPYWVGTYEAFLARQAVLRGAAPGPGTNETAPAAGGWLRRLVVRAYKLLFGYPPHVRIWHPDWLDYRAAHRLFLQHAATRAENILYVKPRIGVFDRTLGGVRVAGVAATLARACGGERAGPRTLKLAMAEIQRGELQHVRRLVELLEREVAPGGQVAIFLKEAGQLPNPQDLADELMSCIGLVAPVNLGRTHFMFAGGRAKKRLHLAFNRCAALYTRRGYAWLPLAVPGMLLVSLLAAVNNLRQARRQELRAPVRECSSFLITVDV